MTIYLIRHGETTGDIEDRYGGDYDDHLTQKGKDQAKALANKLKEKGIQIIYHSPRIRAVETVQILKAELKIPSAQLFDLRERNSYGIMTGMIKSEAKAKFPQEAEKLKDKVNHTVQGSERYEDFKARIIQMFEVVSADKRTTAIITHGGVVSCIIREMLRLGETKKMEDCSYLVLDGTIVVDKHGIIFESESHD